jgi:hypothetical protein
MRRCRAAATCVAVLMLGTVGACHGTGGGATPQPTPSSASPEPTQLRPVPICCAPGGDGGLPNAKVDGAWQGTWTELAAEGAAPHRGELTLVLNQDGTNITGAVIMENSPCLPRAAATGTIKGTALTLFASGGRVTVTLTGGVTNNRSVGGTYTATPSVCGGGTWSASRR